jgi:hypothetical protein
MAFINKQEEVIKLKLTQHGKYLLSTGKFLPDSYAFFDDDIIYDGMYGGVSEHQNDAQDRIKDQIRREAQHTSTGAETRYQLVTKALENESAQEFTPFINAPSPIENEKILGFPLSNMSLGSSEVPRFELSMFESEIEDTTVQYDMLDSSRMRIPQLTINPEHVLVRDDTQVEFPSPDPGDLVDSETFAVNPVGQKIEFQDGSFLEHHPESIIFALEEYNSPYLKENFEIEVFEIVEENANEKLVPIKQYDHLFTITNDEDVDEVPQRKSQRKGFFS